MPVSISDLWVPDVWVSELREKQATFPSLFNSGVVVSNATAQELASGPGTSGNIPFFKDITDQDDEIQIENTGPSTDNGQPSGKMIAVPLNRVTKNSATALAGAIAGADPVGAIISAVLERRHKQRQKTLVSLLRGSFGTAAQANAAAAELAACRLGGTTAEPFDESGLDASADQQMNPDLWIDGKALMGELADDLKGGVFWCHPNVKARLEKLDREGFKTGRPSELPFDIATYRDIPIFTSESLVRAGGVNGYVYDSYLLSRGCIAYGERPQSARVGDIAHLFLDDTDADKNNVYLYDRTRFVLHLNGMKWVGTPSGQSATNAELAVTTNWDAVYQTANRTGAVAMRTNG